MKHMVNGLEHAGTHMTLREIGDEYVLSRSTYPMTNMEYEDADIYARRKMIWNSVFEEDSEFAHVYLGRLIGEVVMQGRIDRQIAMKSAEKNEARRNLQPSYTHHQNRIAFASICQYTVGNGF